MILCVLVVVVKGCLLSRITIGGSEVNGDGAVDLATKKINVYDIICIFFNVCTQQPVSNEINKTYMKCNAGISNILTDLSLLQFSIRFITSMLSLEICDG